jgi:hypothetical protein
VQRRVTQASIRTLERRAREEAAPRLATEFPDLSSLDLEMEEVASTTAPIVSYVRRVVVKAAPALFEIPCGDSGCKDGGHDITYELMAGLRRRQSSIAGEDRCRGSIGTASCPRTLRFRAVARFEALVEPTR